jgi:hypothetical protein
MDRHSQRKRRRELDERFFRSQDAATTRKKTSTDDRAEKADHNDPAATAQGTSSQEK